MSPCMQATSMGFPSLPPAKSGRRRVTTLQVSNRACVSWFITLAGMVGLLDVVCAQQVANLQGRPVPLSA